MLRVFVVLVILSSAYSHPRQKRFDAYDSYPGSYAFGGPFGVGAYAGAGVGFPGFGWNPFFFPRTWVPFFSPPDLRPWYKGPNVCEKKTVVDTPDELKVFFDDDDDDDEFPGSFDFKHESESCRGSGKKYKCFRRESTKDGIKFTVTKYECCYGFVPSTDGSPGCVEKKEDSKPNASSVESSGASHRDHYSFVSSGSSSRSGIVGVENFPVE